MRRHFRHVDVARLAPDQCEDGNEDGRARRHHGQRIAIAAIGQRDLRLHRRIVRGEEIAELIDHTRESAARLGR